MSEGEREAIAKIIDPRSFEMHEICASKFTAIHIREALRKADLILAARPASNEVREALKEAIDVFEGMNDDEINVDLLPKLRAALNEKGLAAHGHGQNRDKTRLDVERALAASPENDRHYLGAIKLRLAQLYELSDDPRIREQISDEVDWIEAALAAEPGERASSARNDP